MVRTHAQSVALVQSEQKEETRLEKRLGALVENYRTIISLLRNLEFVTQMIDSTGVCGGPPRRSTGCLA